MTLASEVLAYASAPGEVTLYDVNLESSQVVLLPSGDEIVWIASYHCPFYTPPMPPDTGSSRFWVLTVGAAGGLSGVHVIERPYLAPGYSLAASWISGGTMTGNLDAFFSVFDTSSRDGARGDFWFTPQFGNEVQGLHYDGAGTITSLGRIDVPDGYMPSALTTRSPHYPPGAMPHPELWVVFSRDVALAGNDRTAWARVFPSSPPPPNGCATPFDVAFDTADFPVAPAVAWSLNFDGERTAWTNLFTEGLARLQMRQGSDPCTNTTLALESFAPDIGIGFDYLVDEQSLQLTMLEQGGNSIVRAYPGGYVIRSSTSRIARGLWPDVFGNAFILFDPPYFGAPASLMETVGAGADGWITKTKTLPAPLRGARAVDYTDGSFWVGTLLPAGVQHVDSTGAVTDFFGAVTSSSAAVQILGPPVLLRSDPASGELYLFFSDDLFGTQGADLVYRVDPRERRPEPHIAALGSGFTLPAGPNVPGGRRVFDAAVQPDYSGSHLVLAAASAGQPPVLHLLRTDPELQLVAEATVPDFNFSPGSYAFGRDLGTNEIALLYADTTGDLVLRRFAPDLSTSVRYDIGRSGVEPRAVACLMRWCFAVWSGSENGIAQLTPSEDLRLADAANAAKLPSSPRSISITVESTYYYRVYVQGEQTATVFQMLENSDPYGETSVPAVGQVRLVSP